MERYRQLVHRSDVPRELWYRYQKTRAEYYDARWAMRAAAVNYLSFIGTEHPRTKRYRGVGFQGITLGIGTLAGSQAEQGYYYPTYRT